MSQNIEIEFKNMLTNLEYKRLLKEFSIDKQLIFSQENYYFDTPDFALKVLGSALRIRKKPDGYELTLKQPAAVGMLETNQPLTEVEADQAILFNKFPKGPIQRMIEETGIAFSDIVYFGSLTTNRVEVEYHQGLLVLDHSIYLGNEDYELELEVSDEQSGKESFLALLKEFGIPVRKTKNKIRRFYEQKYVSPNQHVREENR